MGAIEATGWTRFVDLFRGDMEAVRDVAKVFLDESHTLGDVVQEAVARGEAEALRKAAHSIQSTSRQIGARELADSAARLEAAGKARDMDAARHEVSRFGSLLADTQAELQRRLA